MLNDEKPLRWLFLDLNSYFASVEQQLDPKLRGRPVVVAPVDSDSTCAIAASYEAKAYGIKTGTMIAEAKRRCHRLVVIHARPQAYSEFHEKILDEVQRHLPVTHIRSIDEVACRLMDNENDPLTIEAIAKRIKRGIARNVGACLRCSIGVAPSQLLAKMASDMQKPDGFVVIRGEELPHRLYGLRLRDIPGVGANMERRLLRAGIVSMEHFLSLDRRQARRIWGSVHGERIWWELHGHDLPSQETQTRSLGHSHVLSPEMRSEPRARVVARRLLVKAGSRLRREGYRAGCVVLAVYFENQWEWSASLRLPPTGDSFAFLDRLEQLWESMLAHLRMQEVRSPPKQVSVMLLELVPAEAPQLHLFESDDETKWARHLRLLKAIDEINTDYGRDTARLGIWETGRDDHTATKIAFTRIPHAADFNE